MENLAQKLKRPMALSLTRWQRTPREVGEMLTVVVALQILIGLILTPLSDSLAWTVFIGSQYLGADVFLLLRLWLIPKLRGSVVPETTTFQRVLILASPIWMRIISMYALDRLIP
jgi:hypothetical protein